MRFNPDHHHRRSIRLPGYDYRQPGLYFVTLVCRGRELLLQTPAYAAIVDDSWRWLAQQYAHVHLDEYIVMPNHFHGIIVLSDTGGGGSRTAPTSKLKPLGRIIGAFKTVSTKRINELRGAPGLAVWQRNYYERIIRDDGELDGIRQYIVDNPAQWELDAENPDRL